MKSSGFIRKVAMAMERERMARPGERILVAVSGGPDSVALLAVLDEIRREWNFHLTVAHIDHGLRGADGARDRRFVEELAKGLGYSCVSETATLEPGGNLEARARELRYRFLDRSARSAACERIAVGHTQTDQAETVLLRLLRGSGTRGLSAMSPRRGRIIRPLLDTTRQEVLTFLQERQLVWVDDRTNRDERFARNRLRHRLLPALVAQAGPGVVTRLARTAELLRMEDDFLEHIARRKLARAIHGSHAAEAAHEHLDPGIGAADPRILVARTIRGMPPAIRRRVLRLWIAEARGSLRGITRSHIDALERSLDETESSRTALPGGSVRSEAGVVTWEGEGPPLPAPLSVNVAPGARVIRRDLGWEVSISDAEPWTAGQSLPNDLWTAVFDLARLPEAIVLRSVSPGDRICPLGLGGSRKVQDVLVDRKVPRSARKGVPLLAAGSEVLWIPGLGRSVLATVTTTTSTVVWARFCRLR